MDDIEKQLRELLAQAPGLLRQPGVSVAEAQAVSTVSILTMILLELREIKKLLATKP